MALEEPCTHCIRLADIGFLSGLVAGFVVAVGARLAMRIVAVVDADAASQVTDTGVTGETLFVLFAVTLAGTPLGLLFMGVRR